MAADGHLPIAGLAIEGWRYAFAALSRMPGVLGVAVLTLFVVSIVTLPLLPDPKDEPNFGIQLVHFLLGIVQGFLLTPVAIAMHRFVLLGEVTPRYALKPSEPRFMRFFAFTVVYQFLLSAPMSLTALTGSSPTGPLIAVAVASVVLFVAGVIASLRLLILFPAIAVDASGADWRNAMADTKGHSCRVFFVVVLTALPGLILSVPVYFLLGWSGGATPNFSGVLVTSVVSAVVGVLMLAALATAASKLFAALANRLNG